MKKRILIALGIIILAAGIGAGGWYYYSHHMGTVSGSDTVYVTKISKLSEMDSGVENRYAGVVEPQETVQVKIESGRKVKEVQVRRSATASWRQANMASSARFLSLP